MVHVLGGSQTDFERNWKKEGKNLVALLKEVINDSFKETNFSFEELKRLNKDGELWFVISKDQGAKSIKKHIEMSNNCEVIDKSKGFWIFLVKSS